MKIIVVCTGNSCRSQMAEGLIKNRFPEFEVFSAGTHPESNVNPYAVKVMQEKGIDISSHYPKLVDDLIDTEFDYALTCLLYTSPSPRDTERSRMPSSA